MNKIASAQVSHLAAFSKNVIREPAYYFDCQFLPEIISGFHLLYLLSIKC